MMSLIVRLAHTVLISRVMASLIVREIAVKLSNDVSYSTRIIKNELIHRSLIANGCWKTLTVIILVR